MTFMLSSKYHHSIKIIMDDMIIHHDDFSSKYCQIFPCEKCPKRMASDSAASSKARSKPAGATGRHVQRKGHFERSVLFEELIFFGKNFVFFSVVLVVYVYIKCCKKRSCLQDVVSLGKGAATLDGNLQKFLRPSKSQETLRKQSSR